MLDAIARRAFFALEVPIHHREKAPRIDGTLRDWSAKYLLPPTCEIDGVAPHTDVYAAWNEAGFYIAFDCPERVGPPAVDPRQWWKGDGFRVCIDTRDARENKRGTRFCHLFYALPVGGGKNGRQPVVGIHDLSRAKETPTGIDIGQIQVAAHVERRHVGLEMIIPAAAMHGWDPLEHPRIGFYYKVKSLGQEPQQLTVPDELGWNTDPSTWATAVLVD
jgi:hypothetical protein